MLEIDFIDETDSEVKNYEKLALNLLNSAMKIMNIEKQNISMSIICIDEKKAQKMNVHHRKRTYIPDVLSFPVEMNEFEVEMIGCREIGDLVICFEEAKRKSKKYDHTLEEEMAFIFVHGFLHLMGYDHETSEEDEKIMFELQNKIINSCGLKYEIKFIEEDYLEEEKDNVWI